MLRNSNLLAVVEKVVHMMRCICTCKQDKSSLTLFAPAYFSVKTEEMNCLGVIHTQKDS